jgi:hypothetical protein
MAIVFIKALFYKWRLAYQSLPYAGLVFLLPIGPIGYGTVVPMFRTAIEVLRKFVQFAIF